MTSARHGFAVIILMVCSLSILAAESSYACSCAVSSVEVARGQSVLVFEGVLTRAVRGEGETPGQGTFRVERVWKGTPEQTVTVALNASDFCPPHFEEGKRYVVYAQGTAAAPRIQQCARYAQASQLERERRELGVPTRTFPRR